MQSYQKYLVGLTSENSSFPNDLVARRTLEKEGNFPYLFLFLFFTTSKQSEFKEENGNFHKNFR